LAAQQTFLISYDDGSSASGSVFFDKVAVGGLMVASQAVESAREVSDDFTYDSATSGVFGLAFSSINEVSPTPQKTWFDNIKNSLNAPLFTANLKKSAPGQYGFGFIDTTAYKGTITYTPVQPADGYWQFSGSGYAIGSRPFVTKRLNAIADTGTTLLLLPQAIVKAYWATVVGARYDSDQEGYIFPCKVTLPAFTFGIGIYRGVVPGTYLNYVSVGRTMCFGGIQSQGSSDVSIFGDILLKAQFVVFDMGKLRIGFANKNV
jgi:hypothetical protein